MTTLLYTLALCNGFACAALAFGLTNPPGANIDYAFAFSPSNDALVMHGGWCGPDWFRRDEAWLLSMTGWEAGPAGPKMIHHSGALDTHRAVIVVCGREDVINDSKNVTYEFNGTTWTQKPTLVAGNEGDVEIAYDSARRKIVAYVSDGSSRETWEYDATNWSKITTATLPPRALWGDGALMTFDPHEGRTILVVPAPEPSKSDQRASVTYAYDGTDWSFVAGGPPTNAFMGGMAYDAARTNIVLLTTDSETWTLNGAQWTLRAPAHSPMPPRRCFTMAYDPQRECAVFFSGECITGGVISAFHPIDTWEWDGVDWRQFVPVPEPGLASALAVAGVLIMRGNVTVRRS